MILKIDVYLKDKISKKYRILKETITLDEIEDIVKEKFQNSSAVWVSEDWEYDSMNVDKVEF